MTRDSGRRAPGSGRKDLDVVGSAVRQVVATANSQRLTVRQHRTILAVLSLTASWSKLEDTTYLAEVAKLAWGVPYAHDWQLRKTSEDLRALDAAGVIEREAPKGRPSTSTPPRYRIVLPWPTELTPGSGSEKNQSTPSSVGNAPRVRSETGPGSGTPPSSSPSRSTEEASTCVWTLEELFRSKLTQSDRITDAEIISKTAILEATYGEDEALTRLRGIGGPYDWPSQVEKAVKQWKPDPTELAREHARTLARWVNEGRYQVSDAQEDISDRYTSDRLHDAAVEEFWSLVNAAAA